MSDSVGKNFSGNNVTGLRRRSDFYETPYSLTELFLDNARLGVEKDGRVLEPACGHGAITKVLSQKGYSNVTSYDIESGTDFLDEDRRFDFIITNPPFSLAKEFIEKAIETAPRFAFLLPLSYLHGKERYEKFYRNDDLLKSVHVFTRYPLLGEPLRDDGKFRTGMMVYAWFLFDVAKYGAPTIHWLDNHPYVIGAR